MKLILSMIPIVSLTIACGGNQRRASLPKSEAKADKKEAGPVNFRKSQPKPGAPRDFQLPSIQVFDVAPGVKGYLVEKHTLPTVSVELSFSGGAMNDPSGKEGLAEICMDLQSEGTKKLDKKALSSALANIASGVYSSANDETQSVGMFTLSRNFDATFQIFSDVLTKPGFRKKDLNRLVKQSVEAIRQAKASPAPVAGRLAGRIYYGAKHPFGKVATEKSLAKIKLKDCVAYHKAFIRPGGAKLFVVGDMTQQSVKEKFQPLFERWKGSPKRSISLPPPNGQKGKVFFVDIPGAAQSAVYLVHEGPKRGDKNYFANTLMTQILGGGFASRLNMNLREDKGYSYGARGGFSYNRSFGTLYAYSSVRADATGQSLLEIFREMEELKKGTSPPTKDELSREKNGAILSLPASFATARSTLGMYQNLLYFGLPLSYYDSYVERVSNVDMKDVNRSAKQLLFPSKAKILIVGDGASAQKTRDGEKDVPTLKNGKPVSLREMLKSFAEQGTFGAGDFVELQPL